VSAPKITSFLVKLASRCNLDCDYCYVYHHADQSWRVRPKFLSAAHKKAFCERLAAYVNEAQLNRCVVVLHGGEPLLAGVAPIVQFANDVRKAVGSSATVDIGLQTNGLLLTQEALTAFSAADITVSLSLDGPQDANDLHRKSRRGRSSFAKVLAALERLKEHPEIFAGVIAVIDPSVSPSRIFEFFDEHRPPKLDFLLPDGHHRRSPPGRDIDPDIYTNWLIAAFNLWFDRYPHLPVRTFEALLDAATGLQSGTDAFGYGDVSLITIETDGTYHDLDVFKIVGEGATQLAGSVEDTDISAIAGLPAIAAHRRLLQRDGLSVQCQTCSVVDICGGGSVPHRYGDDGYNQPSVYCAELLALISHVKRRLSAALKLSSMGAPLPGMPSIDFARFELAEEGSAIIRELWRTSSAAAQAGFTSAIRTIADAHDAYAEDAVALLQLPTNELNQLAERPGSIAWQRTLAKTRAGCTVYSVDGKQLVADGSYLAFLRERTSNGAPFEVGLPDQWLQLPFGDAIYFEQETVKDRAGPLLMEALRIIEEWRSNLAAEMRQVNRCIQFIRDPLAHPEKIVSFSDNTVPGALFVSVTQGDRLIDAHDLADSLIHEHRHQKLYLLERHYPMVETTSTKVVSPWREDLRPPSGLLHAVFVFVELRRFWEHLLQNGPSRIRARAISQLAETNANLMAAYETLGGCRLTEGGQALLGVLQRQPALDLVQNGANVASPA
jgi:uncharacterized protein